MLYYINELFILKGAVDLIKLLVVEDEKLFRESLVHRLSKFSDVEVVGACENGIEGLQMVSALEPNTVFTDIRMPGMDGLTFLEKIRQEHPHLITILLTGFTDFHLVKRALQLGAIDYLVKPLKNEELRQTLLNVGKRLESAQQSLTQSDTAPLIWITTIQAWIQNNLKEATLNSAAEYARMNPSAFSRKFHLECGMSFIAYLTRQRIETAEKMLMNPLYKIFEIAEYVGYNGLSHFSKIFKGITGCTPLEFRDRSLGLMPKADETIPADEDLKRGG